MPLPETASDTLKTHRDYLEEIGGNYTTAESNTERQWNLYYHLSHLTALRPLLSTAERGAILDLGTSDGIWYPTIKDWGFKTIYGAELHQGRAEKARTKGYKEVFICDGADIPLPENTLDVIIANAVFVQVLQPEDKIKIFQRAEKILKPGGLFIFSQPPPQPHNYPDEHIEKHCCFVSPDRIIRMAHDHTNLHLKDLRPTYYHWRTQPCPRFLQILRNRVTWRGMPRLLNLYDRLWTHGARSLEESDNLYYSFAKPRK